MFSVEEKPRTFNVDGYTDKDGIVYWGYATQQPDGKWKAMANIFGVLCLVECKITEVNGECL